MFDFISSLGVRNGIKKSDIYNVMSFCHLGTVQHCLSAVKRVGKFTDWVLATINVNDDKSLTEKIMEAIYILK